ncbi:fumarylacetoacetate hydrolase family protein [Muriicola sp. Z0-33]|uniref:fumarylacetoacetate hydrolase family protein n=1 Tax=Muriicola sp. Z0-33 TaxID=2816957 RepID=UPI00223895F5|nr:fumarylacetoacetate hydrolase family protein [Muriicola sp. Z0-33]MCW5514788.1 fumarylacetoacetate hydrolase family protein [Muriicola sp. Z0-33]
MKAYKVKSGVLIEADGKCHLLQGTDWDKFINDDEVYNNTRKKLNPGNQIDNASLYLKKELEAPVKNQEIWASGVTYYNSKLGREEESKEAGGSNFYARVYEADRPELFFKAMGYRAVPSGGMVRKRADSTWDVPEPELTLCITSNAKIIGYTIGNDMSSRSIEGENPLYLPQAKSYDGATAIGPCVLLTGQPLPADTKISISVSRDKETVFDGTIGIDQIKRNLEDLVEYLYRECSFPNGSLLMTGTGIVPSSDFNLQSGDDIVIRIDGIGELKNSVA